MDAYIITQDDFKKLESEWGRLLEACEKDNFFMSWKWLSVWWHRYGFDLEWLLIGVRDGEQLIGIAPFCIKKVLHKKCIALREIQFIGSGLICSEHLDFISLPGRFKEGHTFVEGDIRARLLTPENMKKFKVRLDKLQEISNEIGMSTAELALRFCISNNNVATVATGIRTAEQARQNAAFGRALPAELFERLRNL